ncbi:MAG: FAD:protein FMN transferase, partial [Paracoccaceae bacterium]
MSKTFTDSNGRALGELKLNGPTMGTRYSAHLFVPNSLDRNALEAALFEAVDRIDRQMSTWKADSDLMRLNGAPVGEWVELPPELGAVLAGALDIGRASNGAFDIGLGDIVNAWGFGALRDAPDETAIKQHLGAKHLPAHERLELDAQRRSARKLEPVSLDLCGIAKGFGTDEMIRVIKAFGIENALADLDGELRAIGTDAGGAAWSVAVEKPDYERREAMGVIELKDCAVATSGDYRHWIDVGDLRLSHTMNRMTGGPQQNTVASVSVMAKTGMEADAWATALSVM